MQFTLLQMSLKDASPHSAPFEKDSPIGLSSLET